MFEYTSLKVTLIQAEKLAFDLFNIQGKAMALPGEMDFNFRIKVNSREAYILKISRPNEDNKYLEFQQKLLQHIENQNNHVVAPVVNLDVKGSSISEWIDESGNSRKVRLLSWISGRIWTQKKAA